MASVIQNVFKSREVDFSKLLVFGFVRDSSRYVYRKVLEESGLELYISISENGEVSTEIIDPETNEIYTLHLVDSAVGSFVGKVKKEYEETLALISSECFKSSVFKSEQSKKIIEYVRYKYGDELEFLWDKFPDCAAIRRKDNRKWYGLLLTIQKRKLGLDSDELVEIIDLRNPSEEIEGLVDKQKYFLGYHMNKKHWITIKLDNSVSDEEIFKRIDQSYLLAL